jgi:thiol-disulfide isomerase/thioredoxin
MKSIQVTLSTLALLAIAGCAPAMNNGTDSGVGTDTPTPSADAVGQACAEPPHPNPGAAIGTDFENVSMPYCDNTSFNFYQNNFCDNQLTLIILSAGWCGPCQQEAAQLEAAIVQEYAGRVRVVTVYGQNVNRTPPTANECMSWKNRFHLTSHMVYDPMGVMQRVFPNQAYPSNLIVDRNGRIQSREYGTSSGLQSLKDELDRLLAQ